MGRFEIVLGSVVLLNQNLQVGLRIGELLRDAFQG